MDDRTVKRITCYGKSERTENESDVQVVAKANRSRM